MTGSPRRHGFAVRLLLALGIGTLAGSVLLLRVPAATADDGSPVIIFSAPAGAGQSCGSRPQVSSLSIHTGTRVVIENRIGDSAWLRVGAELVLEVADNTGVRLKLRKGQHVLRLVRSCDETAVLAEPVTVTVASGGTSTDVPEPTTPQTTAAPTRAGQPSASPEASPSPVGASNAAEVAPEPALASATPTASVATPALSPAGVPGPSPVPRSFAEPVGSAVIDASLFDLQPIGDMRRLGLLAGIATVFVVGVMAAIVRAISRLNA